DLDPASRELEHRVFVLRMFGNEPVSRERVARDPEDAPEIHDHHPSGDEARIDAVPQARVRRNVRRSVPLEEVREPDRARPLRAAQDEVAESFHAITVHGSILAGKESSLSVLEDRALDLLVDQHVELPEKELDVV